MSRSSWKFPIVLKENLNFILKKNKSKNIKIIERNAIITSEFLNKKVSIYNGKVFINVFIDKNKIGYKFGEFAYTRKIPIHKKSKKKNNNLF